MMTQEVEIVKNVVRKISIIGIIVKDCEKSFLTRKCDWINGRETLCETHFETTTYYCQWDKLGDVCLIGA